MNFYLPQTFSGYGNCVKYSHSFTIRQEEGICELCNVEIDVKYTNIKCNGLHNRMFNIINSSETNRAVIINILITEHNWFNYAILIEMCMRERLKYQGNLTPNP